MSTTRVTLNQSALISVKMSYRRYQRLDAEPRAYFATRQSSRFGSQLRRQPFAFHPEASIFLL
jgi:hypothetical protein